MTNDQLLFVALVSCDVLYSMVHNTVCDYTVQYVIWCVYFTSQYVIWCVYYTVWYIIQCVYYTVRYIMQCTYVFGSIFKLLTSPDIRILSV